MKKDAPFYSDCIEELFKMKYFGKTESDDIEVIQTLYSMYVYNVMALIKTGMIECKWVTQDKIFCFKDSGIWFVLSGSYKETVFKNNEVYGTIFPISVVDRENSDDYRLKSIPEDTNVTCYSDAVTVALLSVGITREIPIIVAKKDSRCKIDTKLIDNYDLSKDDKLTETVSIDGVKLFNIKCIEQTYGVHNSIVVLEDEEIPINVVLCYDNRDAMNILKGFEHLIAPLALDKFTDNPVKCVQNRIFNDKEEFDKIMAGSSVESHCPADHEEILCCRYCIDNAFLGICSNTCSR